MSRKIGIIVEGATDKDFFDKYLKKKYPALKGIKVISSATNRMQKIRNKSKLHSRIKDLQDKNDCTEIYILIDLDDKQCVVTEKKEFEIEMNLSIIQNLTTVVASTELESWMQSAWEKSNKKTKEDLKRRFNIKSDRNLEENILKNFLKSRENIKPENNQSLYYFLRKIRAISEEE